MPMILQRIDATADRVRLITQVAFLPIAHPSEALGADGNPLIG